ncbi:MAG TPA: hypothetical protein VFT65_17420 [Candidatus Angelobacter sp.]|nr:hypothetical protein [Candidatus Angelobacter sp.]
MAVEESLEEMKFIMRKIALTLVALAFLVSVSVAKDPKAPKSTKMAGWVSDEKCGAKDIDNADCAKKCAEAGSKLVFVSEKDKSVINVDNPDALKGHEGHHVTVTGSMSNGSLHVDKVDMLKESKAKAEKS